MAQEKTDKKSEIQEVEVKVEPKLSEVSPELQNIKGKDLEQNAEGKGIIFAKTDFQGVLQTSFVKLFFENQKNLKYKFQLHIGDKSRQTAFPWDVKTVHPGYFFIELPVGPYKITSVSIPVGSTMATEAIDISLEVLPNKIVYIGTLSLVGTKEKIKLGGVPLIKPGFEYKAVIIDERKEGMDVFRQRYPNSLDEIIINLMKVNAL